jgi:hypothetical protein
VRKPGYEGRKLLDVFEGGAWANLGGRRVEERVPREEELQTKVGSEHLCGRFRFEPTTMGL